jgi:hypothetical protein
MYLIITVEETRRIDVILKRVSGTIITVKNYKYYIFCVCVTVALIIQHAMRMRRIVLTSVASLAVTYTFTLSHKRDGFWIKFS